MNDKCQPQEMPNKGVGVVAVDVIEVNKNNRFYNKQFSILCNTFNVSMIRFKKKNYINKNS